MTTQHEAPTGREVRAHVERWGALPEAERPLGSTEWWSVMDQEWKPDSPDVDEFPDDATPQPGLRLVPLPEPRPEVGVGWREPVDLTEALLARADGVLWRDYEKAPSRPARWGRCGWAPAAITSTRGFRVPASWAPGRERVRLIQAMGRCIDGQLIDLVHEPGDHDSATGWVEVGFADHDATVINGTAYVWVDPIEDPAPETERVDDAAARVHHLVDEYGLTGVQRLLRTHEDWRDSPTEDDIIERAWGLLANVSEGDWTQQTQQWQEAVVRWRDEMFHPWLDRTSTPDWPIEGETADGTESAAPSDQSPSDPAGGEAVADCSGEVASEGESSGSPSTRPDPPEGWVVCRDREILRAADERRMVRWWWESWSRPGGGWDYDARQVDDDRFAVPVSIVPAEPWVPQVGDRVLIEAVAVHFDVRDGGRRPAPGSLRVRVEDTSEVDGFVRFWSPSSSLRPFPEDGA